MPKEIVKQEPGILRITGQVSGENDIRANVTGTGFKATIQFRSGTPDDMKRMQNLLCRDEPAIIYIDGSGVLAATFLSSSKTGMRYHGRNVAFYLEALPRLGLKDIKLERDFTAPQLAVLLAFYERADVDDEETAASVTGVDANEIRKWLIEEKFRSYYEGLLRHRKNRLYVKFISYLERKMTNGELSSSLEKIIAAALGISDVETGEQRSGDDPGNANAASDAINAMSIDDISRITDSIMRKAQEREASKQVE